MFVDILIKAWKYVIVDNWGLTIILIAILTFFLFYKNKCLRGFISKLFVDESLIESFIATLIIAIFLFVVFKKNMLGDLNQGDFSFISSMGAIIVALIALLISVKKK